MGVPAGSDVRVGRDGKGRPAQTDERVVDAMQLIRREMRQDLLHQVLTDQLDGVQHQSTIFRESHEHHAPVFPVAFALHEPTFLHPVDESRDIRQGHAQEISEVTHGEVAVVVEHRQHVQMRHAHALLHKALRPDAPQLAEGHAQLGEDLLDLRGNGLRDAGVAPGDGLLRWNTSYHANNHT